MNTRPEKKHLERSEKGKENPQGGQGATFIILPLSWFLEKSLSKSIQYYTVHVWEKDESLLASISRKTFSFIIIQLDFILEGMSYLVENGEIYFYH